MPEAAIASEIHQALYIHRDIPAEVALDLVVLVDVVTNTSDFSLGEVVGSRVEIDSTFSENFLRC